MVTPHSIYLADATTAVFTDDTGSEWARLTRIHPRSTCYPRACAIHAPTEHPMRRWPLAFMPEHQLIMRRCPHGCGHPDPDTMPYLDKLGLSLEEVHDCDGCCPGRRVIRYIRPLDRIAAWRGADAPRR